MNERIKFIPFYQAFKYVDSHFIRDCTKNTKDLAKWAFSVVHTRHIQTSDGNFKIVPMADIINHHRTNADAEIQISYDDDGNCGVHTNYDITAGSSLRISYGDPSNPSYAGAFQMSNVVLNVLHCFKNLPFPDVFRLDKTCHNHLHLGNLPF